MAESKTVPEPAPVPPVVLEWLREVVSSSTRMRDRFAATALLDLLVELEHWRRRHRLLDEAVAAVDSLQAENATLAQLASEIIEKVSIVCSAELETAPNALNAAIAMRELDWNKQAMDALTATLDRERSATDDEVTAEWQAARAASAAAGFDMSTHSLPDVITSLADASGVALVIRGLPN